MRRLAVNSSVFIWSLCITLMGCAQIASNNLGTPSGVKKYGKQEAIARGRDTTGTTAAAMNGHANDSSRPPSQAMVNARSRDCSALTEEHKNIYFKSEAGPAEKLTTVKVGATGYGAPPKNYYPEGQRRLMTIRASKIDAYRALAEVVGGLHLWGGSAIGDMVIERDRYRVFVDSYVRGAHVLSVEATEDGTYKTLVEMEVDQRFLNHVMTFIDPAADRYCYEQEADGSMKYYGYSVAPSFYYSE